ncbi:pentatricopeptide repeat-containing protein At1g62260, mitochondrial-like [Wolffia australiana]
MVLRSSRSLLRKSSCQTLIATYSGGSVDDGFFRRQNSALAKILRLQGLQLGFRHFRELRRRNVVTWNTILGACVRHREILRARAIFNEMPAKDVISWNTMLSGYAVAGQIDDARKLFDEMPERDAVSWNSMISGYARCGRIFDAVRLFDEMPVRNSVSWNAVVTGLLGCGGVEQAIRMWRKMPVRDSASLSALISGLSRNGMLDVAETALLDAGEGDVDAYNTLIAAFGRAGRVDNARRLFEMVPCAHAEGKRRFQRNVISWNSMIMSYMKVGMVQSAKDLFDEMVERDSFSWNTMIAGYVQSGGMDEAMALLRKMPYPEERTWNLMISGLARNGDLNGARRLFDMMPCRNTISWNTLIAGYDQAGEHCEALSLFSTMMSSGEVAPDGHSLSAALSACASLASLCHGKQVHQVLTKRVAPDTPISNALITMYARCGSLTDARLGFDTIMTRRDVVSWNAIISSYAQHGRADEALQLFSLMGAEVLPTHITFVSLLHACCHAGLVDHGRHIFDAMVHQHGISPQMEHYAALVDLFGRHGRLEEAVDIVISMPLSPGQAVWGALLGACRVNRNDELALLAMEGLAKADPVGSAPYVLLCNMHASVGQWEEAADVREAMEQQGIRKQTGFSWIELPGSTHVFTAGDMSHPFSLQILAAADWCSRAIRDEINFNPLSL